MINSKILQLACKIYDSQELVSLRKSFCANFRELCAKIVLGEILRIRCKNHFELNFAKFSVKKF